MRIFSQCHCKTMISVQLNCSFTQDITILAIYHYETFALLFVVKPESWALFHFITKWRESVISLSFLNGIILEIGT